MFHIAHGGNFKTQPTFQHSTQTGVGHSSRKLPRETERGGVEGEVVLESHWPPHPCWHVMYLISSNSLGEVRWSPFYKRESWTSDVTSHKLSCKVAGLQEDLLLLAAWILALRLLGVNSKFKFQVRTRVRDLVQKECSLLEFEYNGDRFGTCLRSPEMVEYPSLFSCEY